MKITPINIEGGTAVRVPAPTPHALPRSPQPAPRLSVAARRTIQEYLERLRAVYEPQIGKPLEVKPMGPGKGSKRIKDPITNKWYWDKCKVAG